MGTLRNQHNTKFYSAFFALGYDMNIFPRHKMILTHIVLHRRAKGAKIVSFSGASYRSGYNLTVDRSF